MLRHVLTAALLGLGLLLLVPEDSAQAQSWPDPMSSRACGTPSDALRATEPLAVLRRGLPGKPLRILAIGSSSTFGAGATSPAMSYPAQLQERLGAIMPVEVENAGISGEQAATTVARLSERLARGSYDLVLWQVGTNDALGDVAEQDLLGALETGYAATARAGARLLLIDPQDYPKARSPERYARFVTLIDDFARSRRIPLFARHEWMRSLPGMGASLVSADGLHMNDRGYACIAGLLSQDIADHIASRQNAQALRHDPASPAVH
jgi:acyl-CoA thioesterase-1